MTMVQFGWMKGSGSEVANYFSGGDYYLDSDVDAKWHGKYKESLGLPDKVNKDDLKAILNNRNPLGGKLTQRDSPNRRAALEIVFSAPKSLSVLNAIVGDTRIRKAFDDTLLKTMHEIEKDAQRRLRVRGQDTSIHTGNLIYAVFPHQLGRPVKGVPDPQMHSHVMLANATYDAKEGKWYALDASQIISDSQYYKAFFRNTLAQQLTSLGYTLKYSKDNFEIEGVSKAIRDKFSNRTAQVEEAAEKYGITRENTKATLGAMTREKKNNKHSMEELEALWSERLTPKEAQELRDTYLKSLGYTDRMKPDFSAKYVDKAMDELNRKDTFVPERKLITAALKMGMGKVSLEGIQNHIQDKVDTGEHGGFIRQKRVFGKLSTRKALLKDIETKDLWKAGLGKFEKLGRDTYTVKAPKKSHLESLNKLYGSRDRYTSMRGNIGRPQAIQRAKADLGAGIVNDLDNLPTESIWFVTKKIDDGDMPKLLEDAKDRDARIVFWGDKERSQLEIDLNLTPIEMFDRKQSDISFSTRLKNAVLYNLTRIYDVAFEKHREVERSF